MAGVADIVSRAVYRPHVLEWRHILSLRSHTPMIHSRRDGWLEDRMRRVALVLAFLAGSFTGITADSLAPLLLQKPTLSRTHIAFVYAGDLWTVTRDGGAAQRLTSGPGVETNPVYAPDGST